jgi:hypothetical protein
MVGHILSTFIEVSNVSKSRKNIEGGEVTFTLTIIIIEGDKKGRIYP